MTTIGVEGFRAAAATLGLRLEAPDVSWWKNQNFAMLEGVVDGTSVLVQQGSLSATSIAMRVYFHAALEPELDLGLGISLRGSYIAQAVGLEREPLGVPTFDQAFVMKAAEPSRVPAFLTPEMRAALIGWHNARKWERDAESKNSLEFWITDESVIVRIQTNALGFGSSTQPLHTEELVRDIRATAALARSLNEAAKHVPPSTILAPHAAMWRTFAAAHHLVFLESPLRMTGTFEGVRFAARAASLGAEGYGVDLTMPFARPLPCYLRLGPTGGWFDPPKYYPDAWAEWAERQKTGDSAFDSELRVVSADPIAQNALLTPEIRRALLDLHATHEHVHMTTESISVRTKSMVSPEVFAAILKPLAAVEKMIDRSAAR